MNKFIKFPLILGIVGAIATFALALVFQITDPLIQSAKNGQETEAVQSMFEGKTILVRDDIEIDDCALEGGVAAIYEAKDGETSLGIIYKITVQGYGGKVSILISISPDKMYNGYKVLDVKSETPSFGGAAVYNPSFEGSFNDLPIKGTHPSYVSGATVTTAPLARGIEAAAVHYSKNFCK